ncbi:MAG: Gfo/Idh/MocA family oxidoreductase [Proteobacteria bacterium]|nr:Gfo/Idh/MocA family oxidoreductase [Pseudomonadota bacterium]
MRMMRWGMIGCGDVTEVKSGPGFYKARNSSLVAVMRRNAKLAVDYAERHRVPRWHDDADAIFKATDIDIVYVATLTDSHRDYTLRLAAAGKPVYVEKPMAMTHAECLEMIAACKRHGVKLFVAYYRRAMPYFHKVRELVAEIAPVRMVATTHRARPPAESAFADGALPWRVNPSLSGGGFFFEQVCHTVDILDWLFGPMVEVHGIATNRAGLYRPEDTVSAALRFQSGVLGSGSWCYAAEDEIEESEIVGAKGRLVFSTFSFKPIRLIRAGAATEFSIPLLDHVQQPLIQTIVDELNGIGTCPSTGESGARTAWVMEQILASFAGSADGRRDAAG